MKKLIFIGFTAIILLSMSNLAIAQKTKSTQSAYRKSPVWIDMMNAEHVNFFEVKSAFEIYWEKRELPKEEEDIIGQKFATETDRKEKSTWLKKLFGDKREVEESKMAYEVKRYRFWCLNMSPWVQEDGSILPPEKRLEIMQSLRKP
ncbi:hypothetical protein BH11BAC2_BH11BAC2_14800 [soil metagenome]